MVRDCIRSIDLEARRIDIDLGSSVKADVFTLFPQWFEWFRTQRHVENALALGPYGRRLRLPRRDAPQVGPGRRHAVRRRGRDGPARRRDGGRAARALRRRPGRVARDAARDRLDAGRAAARRRAGLRTGVRARADAAVRPLRGLRRAHPRALRLRPGLDRPLRAGRGRAGGDGRARHGPAQAPRRARRRHVGDRGVVLRGPRRRTGVSALHAARGLAWLGGSRRPALGPPRRVDAWRREPITEARRTVRYHDSTACEARSSRGLS